MKSKEHKIAEIVDGQLLVTDFPAPATFPAPSPFPSPSPSPSPFPADRAAAAE